MVNRTGVNESNTTKFDALIDTAKNLSLLVVAIPTICISLLSTNNPTSIAILLSMASIILGCVFVLFKIASLKPKVLGLYARGRALTATFIVLLSWIIVSSLLLLMFFLSDFTTISQLHLSQIFGLSSGVLVGIVVLIFEKGEYQTRLLKQVGVILSENEDTKEYPWKFPWPSNYLHAGLITFASVHALLPTGSFFQTEFHQFHIIAGFSTLASLLFLLGIQTYLEPVQYVTGRGDFFFGLATSGAILSLTLSYFGVLLTIVSTFLLIFTRRENTIDIDSVARYVENEEVVENQFIKNHGLFWGITSVMVAFCMVSTIVGGIVLILIGYQLLFIASLLSVIEIGFIRLVVKWWCTRKKRISENEFLQSNINTP